MKRTGKTSRLPKRSGDSRRTAESFKKRKLFGQTRGTITASSGEGELIRRSKKRRSYGRKNAHWEIVSTVLPEREWKLGGFGGGDGRSASSAVRDRYDRWWALLYWFQG